MNLFHKSNLFWRDLPLNTASHFDNCLVKQKKVLAYEQALCMLQVRVCYSSKPNYLDADKYYFWKTQKVDSLVKHSLAVLHKENNLWYVYCSFLQDLDLRREKVIAEFTMLLQKVAWHNCPKNVGIFLFSTAASWFQLIAKTKIYIFLAVRLALYCSESNKIFHKRFTSTGYREVFKTYSNI